nr:MarR family transcriptional regulator [Agrobacterium sp. Ap1]
MVTGHRALITACAAEFHPDLQPAAYQIALTIDRHGGCKTGELASILDMDKSAVSRLTKSLSENGLVTSRTDPSDGRGTIFELSRQGRQNLERSNTIKGEAFFARLADWSAQEMTHFSTLLEKFNRSSHSTPKMK